MGLFDDIPAASTGLFDDIQAPAKGMFDDIASAAAAPAPPQVPISGAPAGQQPAPSAEPAERGIVQRIIDGFQQGGGENFGEYQPKGESRAVQAADATAKEAMAFPGRAVGAGSGAVAGLLEMLGMKPANADRLQRDIGQAAQVSIPSEMPKPTTKMMTKPVVREAVAEVPKVVEPVAAPEAVAPEAVAPEAVAPKAVEAPPTTPIEPTVPPQIAAQGTASAAPVSAAPAGVPPAPPGGTVPPAGAPPAPPGGTPPIGPGHNQGPPLNPAQQSVLSRVAPQPKTKTPMGEMAHDAYTQLVDDLHPIKRVVEEGTPAAQDPYVQFRLTRGSAGKAEHMLRHGTFDFANPELNTGAPLADVLKPLNGERDQFSAYLLAKRAVELDQRGIDTGIPLADAQQVAAAGQQRYGAAAQALDTFQEQTLKYFKDSGIISQDAFDNMRSASQSYIPLYRAFDPQPMSRRFNVSNTIKKLTGSDEKILDPIESVIRNTYVLTEMAERNRAATTLVDYAKANPNNIPMKKVSNQANPIPLSSGEIDRIMADHGVPRSVYGQAGSSEIFRPDRKGGLGEGEFAVYENGKRTVYKTTPEIADAVKRMDQSELSVFTKMAAAPARMLRAGVTLDPAYMMSNIIRDQLSATVQSKSNYRPGIDTLSGAWSRALKDKSYKDWLKSGATQSTMVSQDRNYSSNFIKEYGAKPNVLEAIKRHGGKPIEILRDISEAADNMTRLGEFKKARKGGADLMESGFRSREVTQDFQRLGAKTRAWNAVTAFANGQIQGFDKEVRNFKERPFGAAAKIASYITMPSVLFWMANKDDPRYQNADNSTKDMFWLYLPEDPNADPIKIPKGFTTGVLGGSMIERTLDKYFKDRPEAYKDFTKSVLGTMTPNVVPTLAQPMLEQWANRSTFTGNPLIGQRVGRLPAKEQVTQGTSDTAKAAAAGLDKLGVKNSFASPIVLDNYIRSWGGQVGQYAKAGSDAALRALGAVDKRPDAPEGKLSTIPGLRRFVMQYPSANAQPIKDFYDKYTEAESAFNSNKEARRRGEPGGERVMRLAGLKRQLDGLHKQVRDTYDSTELSPREKREKIDAAYVRMLDTAQRGLKLARGGR